MVTVINMTDHPVVVLGPKNNGYRTPIASFPPSGEVLRMDESWEPMSDSLTVPVEAVANTAVWSKDGLTIPIVRRRTGSLRVNHEGGGMSMFDRTAYPDDALFIVSSQVLMAFPAMDELICPAQIVREGRRVIGCRSFSHNGDPAGLALILRS